MSIMCPEVSHGVSLKPSLLLVMLNMLMLSSVTEMNESGTDRTKQNVSFLRLPLLLNVSSFFGHFSLQQQRKNKWVYFSVTVRS